MLSEDSIFIPLWSRDQLMLGVGMAEAAQANHSPGPLLLDLEILMASDRDALLSRLGIIPRSDHVEEVHTSGLN